MPKKLPYREGTAFSVTLPDGGFALGVVARMAPRGKVLLGYFFGPRQQDETYDLETVDPKRAILVGMFGDLHLFDHKWKVIGEMPAWDRAKWPIPLFRKRDPLGYVPDQVVIYDEDDLAKSRWERWASIPSGLADDGLMGAGYVEIKLDMLLT